MSARDAQRGYIFQTKTAMIVCLDRDDWDKIKLEPDTEMGNASIFLYCDEAVISAMQVKSSINKFNRRDVMHWLERLEKDAQGVKEVLLFLIGDSYTASCEEYIRQNSEKIIRIPFSHLDDIYKEKLVKYANKVNHGNDVQQKDLDLIDAILFTKIHTNSIAQEPLTRDELEEAFQKVLLINNNSSADFSSYYQIAEKKFTSKKLDDMLVGEESDEKAYIDVHITVSEKPEPAETFLENWFVKDNSGTLLIHGEPGQGKTMLCNKATFDFWRGSFLKDKAKNVLTVSLNTGKNPRIIENKKVILSNALFWGANNEHHFSFEDCRESLLFLDGFDEFINDAKGTNIDNIISFIKLIDSVAKEYSIHIVVLSRTSAVSTYLGNLSGICNHYKLSPLSHKQQDDWLEKHTEYSSYKQEFNSLRSESRMEEILGIPLMFRLVVYNHISHSVFNTTNIVELYDDLFSKLMNRRGINNEEKQIVDNKLMNLAFEMYYSESFMCDRNDTNWDTSWLYSFFVITNDYRKIEFLHKSFYEYYLAKYIYREIINISEENGEKTPDEKAEILIGSLDVRILDSTVLEYLSCLLNKENEIKIRTGIKKMEDALSNTEAYLNHSPRFNSGDAERPKTLRLNNITVNTHNISDAFKNEISTPSVDVIQINSFFEKDPSIYCSFDAFFEFLQNNNTEEMRKFISEELQYLFQISEADNTIVPVYDNTELQQLLYHLWMIDTNRLEDMEIEQKSDLTSEQGQHLPDEALKLKEQENASSELKPSDVEIATELVLKDFQQWWEKKLKEEGLNYRIIRSACYQKNGDQFGNVVGMEMQIGNTNYKLYFDSEEYASNIQVRVNNKDVSINEYEIKLLKLYKDSRKTESKIRWVLINPYVNLNNAFPEELFLAWNEDHDKIKVFPLIENQSSLACRQFFSVNETAFRLVYKEEMLPSVEESEVDNIFSILLDKIASYDDIKRKLDNKLRCYSIPSDFIQTQASALLPERTDKDEDEDKDAMQTVLDYLKEINNHKSDTAPGKNGIYIIGALGTGKTWLLYRTIKKIINRQEEYPYEPVLMSLKDYGQFKSTMEEQDIPDYVEEYINSILKEYTEKGIGLSGSRSPLFLLDGFDEVLSGLSETNYKIKVLLNIINKLLFLYENSKPVFIVTSRESDYHACHTNKEFIKLFEKYHKITLVDCQKDEVKTKLLALAEKSNERRETFVRLSENPKILSVACRPIFFKLLTRLVWNEKTSLDYVVDEFSLLDEVVNSEIRRTIKACLGDKDRKDEMKLRESLQEKLFECAVFCTQNNVNKAPFEWEDKAISENIPVGLFTVVNKSAESAEQNSPWTFSTKNSREFTVGFLHNTVREFLVAKKYFQLLDDVNNGCGDRIFLDELVKIQMSPASLRFFITWIRNSPNKEEYKNRITKWLCEKEKKSNLCLATRLLELVLQPNCTFGGEAGSLLDLTDICADNLCIWNCKLQNIDLRRATLHNMQMTDTELVNIDFRGADLTGLQVAPMKPIIDLCKWEEEGEWRIAVLYQNGQMLQYSFTNQFTQGNYSIKILMQAKNANGLIVLDKTKYWITRNDIYSMEEQDEKSLFHMKSAKLIHQIIPREKTNCIVVDHGNEYWVYVCQNDTHFTYKLDRKDVEHFCMTNNGLLLTVNGKCLELVDSMMNATRLCDLGKDFECFTIHQENNRENHIYIKYADKLIQVVYDSRFKYSTTMEFPIEGIIGTVQKIYAIKNGILIAISQSDLFILTVEDGKVRADKVNIAVKSSDIILENSDGTEKIKDQYAYELLSGSVVG